VNSDSRRRNADDVDSDGIMNHERTTDALAHSSVNDPALLADQSSSEFTGHSVRRGRTEGRNSLRMKDVRFEQLRQAAGDTLFSDLQSKADIEVPQFTFTKAAVVEKAGKLTSDLGNFGSYVVQLSIMKSNLRSAENRVTAAVNDYKDAVMDVKDAQKEAMRMLDTLAPDIDRWSEASISIVKLQHSLAAAHALDQKAMQRFVRAAQGAAVMQGAVMKDISAAASALRQASASVKLLAQCRQDAWDRLNALHMTVQTAAAENHDAAAMTGSDAMAITNQVLQDSDSSPSAIHSLPDLQDFRD